MGRRNIKSAVENKEISRKTKKPVKLNEAKSQAEIAHKKNLAMILQIATYTPSQIASTLGEKVSTVRTWRKDPAFQKAYEDSLKVISGAAKEYMETLTIEAVKRMGELMRQHDDPQLALSAAKEILDRGGMPKISRNERKDEAPDEPIRHKHEHEHHISTPGQADAVNELIAQAEAITREGVQE
jgi:hypothetical protein